MRIWKVEGALHRPKGHDQEIIMDFMNTKGNFGNIDLLHIYMVVARTKIKFGKELSTTQFIQKVINDENGKFIFDGNFVEGLKIRAHSPCTLFLEYHDDGRRIRDGTNIDDTHN
jgi:hypothetical protein